MKTTVILIRHGETEWNVLHRFQGLSDIPLNDTGRQQAGFAKNGLQNITLDAIYTSPLQRAVETAEIIRGDRNIPVYPTDGLQEMGVGEWEGLKSIRAGMMSGAPLPQKSDSKAENRLRKHRSGPGKRFGKL